ncbi:ABC transporter permease [Paralimibaculum aggregatum]|uniref:ABC transporter permease n=1 Tax=Paralimibaculum aggregatum TaxID=3036245 RepID=A0ABQ6LCR6_9RHOB|nr:ABC transporter permease [Limibaculum sp. NKW23]GMG81165.1 ABC transporter permease [Limibaculum sp. NKW23]
MTRLPAWADYGLIPVLNLGLAFAVAALVIAALGEDPAAALEVLVAGAFVYEGALGYTLFYTASFIFTGLAVAVAFQARLFNIGAEGQAMLGGLGAAGLCLAFDAVLPALLMIPLAIAGAAAAGAAWGAVPGWLQARRGSHIVITTIMFNFLASGLVVGLLSGPLMRPGQSNAETRALAESARIAQWHEIAPLLGLEAGRSPLNLSILLAVAACIGVWWLIWRTRWGYALRCLGLAAPAAEYAGIPVARITVQAMAVSGALAGLMAVNTVLGAQGKLLINFTAGFGFTGIAVALMGRGHPFGVALAALLFGALYQGGAEFDFEFATITREMVLLVQGLIVLFTGALSQMLVPLVARALGRA